MPQINGGRLLADLRRLAEFGAYKSGVHRPTFSPQDIEARRWLAGRFAEAGLEASIDGIGNVFGRSRATGFKLLLGSHTESQNHAGWLDRALGVIYGLEVARAFREDARTARSAIDALGPSASCRPSHKFTRPNYFKTLGALSRATALPSGVKCICAESRLSLPAKRSNPAERTAPTTPGSPRRFVARDDQPSTRSRRRLETKKSHPLRS